MRNRRWCGWLRRRQWRKQKILGLRVGAVPVPEKMQPFVAIRGMAGAMLDLQRQSLGQNGAARCARARGKHGSANGGAARGGKKGSLLSSNLGLGRPCARGTKKVKFTDSSSS
jgi:hypothetical protein